MRSGRVDGTIVLADERTTIDGTVDARGIATGGITLARLTANAKLVNGSGQVRAAFAGRARRRFRLLDPRRCFPRRDPADGQGSDRAPAAGPERAGGADARGRRLGACADEPDLRGRRRDRVRAEAARRRKSTPSSPECRSRCSTCSGPISACRAPLRAASIMPGSRNRSGRLDLKVRGLSRAGLVLASKPIDVGIAAIVNGNQAAMRAVAASDGAIVGRAQARFAPMGGGPLVAELMNAPLFAQLRYSGPADTLWRLTGSEVLDMSGPLAVGADIGGRLTDPVIRGSLRTQNARLESQVTGMVIDHVAAEARFSGPQLIFNQISRPDHRRRVGHRHRLGDFFRRQRASEPRVHREPGAAAQSRRCRRARDRTAETQFRRERRDDLRQLQAQQRPLPARPGEQRPRRSRSSTCARPASTLRR